jgi:hypothetical protein
MSDPVRLSQLHTVLVALEHQALVAPWPRRVLLRWQLDRLRRKVARLAAEDRPPGRPPSSGAW